MRNGISTAKLTLNIISDGSPISIDLNQKLSTSSNQFSYEGFLPVIQMSNVSFDYSKTENWSISDFNLTIGESEIVAIVGPSGAGKTSVVDLILGIFPPESGTISISGLSPLDAFRAYPGAVSYVPQEIYIADASIRRNVALGFEDFKVSDEEIWMALKNASLDEFVKGLDRQLDFEVGESGARLSGGQRQRLGIARALFTKPRLIVLDEATSALDSQSEQDISRAIKNLRGSVTVLLIAHRLSTVQDCDRVIYINNGKKEADGTFLEVKKSIPSFAEQAQLLGL
jgi:ABC-type multidrug transport system fused ATPase/permease subunit